MIEFLSIDYGSPLLPEIYFIDPWLPGEKCKLIIIRDADKALYLLTQGTLSTFRINATFIELFSYLRTSPFTGKKIICECQLVNNERVIKRIRLQKAFGINLQDGDCTINEG